MSSRGIALIVAAVLLSAAVLGVQLASGGSDFVPQRAADPCQAAPKTSTADLEGLAQAVVLTGLDETACKLGVSRERLVLALASQADRAALAREAGTDERGVAQALKDGLLAGVDRLEQTGQLPKASALLPSVAGQLGIPPGLAALIPASAIDNLLPTGDVLRRSLDKVDVDTILAGLNDPGTLETTLRDAVVQGATDEARAKLKDALPGGLQGLLGG